MSGVILVVGGLVLLAGLALLFRRRTLWFLLERWRQGSHDLFSGISHTREAKGAASWARVPERVTSQTAGVVVGAFLGSGVLAVAGFAALYGEVALAIGTAYSFTGEANAPALNIGLALGVATVSAVVFWSMVTTELAGFTNYSAWIRPDHLESTGRRSDYDEAALKVRKWGLPALSVGMVVLSVWVLVKLALFREQLLLAGSSVESMEGYAEFLNSQSRAHGQFWALQAVVMSISAAFGAIAIKDFLTLGLTTLLFGGASVLLGIGRFFADLLGSAFGLILGSLQDLIHLVEPAAEEGLAQPYEDMGFWQEYDLPEDLGEEFDLEDFDPEQDLFNNQDIRIVT